MSKIALELQNMVKEKIEHECEVWFDPNLGWMFKASQLPAQRVGYNNVEAREFIEKFDWSWIKDHLEKE